MLKRPGVLLAVLSSATCLASVCAVGAEKIHDAIVLPGPAGKFDWMMVDAIRHRLLAAHRDANTAEILDLKTGKLIGSVKTGAAQGVAMDRNLYFFGDEKDQKVVIIDAKTLKLTKEIAVPGEVDAMAYDDVHHKLYVDHDNGKDVWVIDPSSAKMVATISIDGAPEFVEYDKLTNKVYQAIKTTNTVAVINPVTYKVEKSWSTLPAEKPHGLAIDSKSGRLFTAGSNGKLVVIDLKTGKVTGSVDIAKRVDQIAFDPGTHNICCACAGFVSVANEAPDGSLKAVKDIATHKGAHTLAIDPDTHAVWLSYTDEAHSYLQRVDIP